jgi:hypothetical protein
MSTDADHEVIDSPEALFRHLYEAHQVEEALDLDPASAPVQFWLRRHAELEREAGTARRPAEPGPRPPAAGRDGRRPAGFGDPLVEAVARALAGRGHDEAAVRGAIRGYASPAGGRTGEAAVRGDFVEPMLLAAAERLLGAGRGAAQPGRPGHAPAGRPEGNRPEGNRPEAAWAGLWADLDLGDGGTRRGAAERPGEAADDDLMAIADAVQRRRGRRLAEREPRPLRR